MLGEIYTDYSNFPGGQLFVYHLPIIDILSNSLVASACTSTKHFSDLQFDLQDAKSNIKSS
jgi:hypothetical protein